MDPKAYYKGLEDAALARKGADAIELKRLEKEAEESKEEYDELRGAAKGGEKGDKKEEKKEAALI